MGVGRGGWRAGKVSRRAHVDSFVYQRGTFDSSIHRIAAGHSPSSLIKL